MHALTAAPPSECGWHTAAMEKAKQDDDEALLLELGVAAGAPAPLEGPEVPSGVGPEVLSREQAASIGPSVASVETLLQLGVIVNAPRQDSRLHMPEHTPMHTSMHHVDTTGRTVGTACPYI